MDYCIQTPLFVTLKSPLKGINQKLWLADYTQTSLFVSPRNPFDGLDQQLLLNGFLYGFKQDLHYSSINTVLIFLYML